MKQLLQSGRGVRVGSVLAGAVLLQGCVVASLLHRSDSKDGPRRTVLVSESEGPPRDFQLQVRAEPDKPWVLAVEAGYRVTKTQLWRDTFTRQTDSEYLLGQSTWETAAAVEGAAGFLLAWIGGTLYLAYDDGVGYRTQRDDSGVVALVGVGLMVDAGLSWLIRKNGRSTSSNSAEVTDERRTSEDLKRGADGDAFGVTIALAKAPGEPPRAVELRDGRASIDLINLVATDQPGDGELLIELRHQGRSVADTRVTLTEEQVRGIQEESLRRRRIEGR